MLQKLIDINLNNQISDLPDVIKTNNDIIANEFDQIYDSSQGYIKTSLVAPQGKVQSHWGEFTNLRCQDLYITGNVVLDNDRIISLNSDSDQPIDTNSLYHNKLYNKFSWEFPNPDKIDTKNYAHDTKIICSVGTNENPIKIGDESISSIITLREELDKIENILGELCKNLTVKDSAKEDSQADDLKLGSAAQENAKATFNYNQIRAQIKDLTNRVQALENQNKI